jgi:hypothetical protein
LLGGGAGSPILGSVDGRIGILGAVAHGARKVEDDLLLVVRFPFFLLDDAVRMQELVGDVGKNRGAARRDAAFGGLDEEAGKEFAEVFGRAEVREAAEEFRGKVVKIGGRGGQAGPGPLLEVCFAKTGAGGREPTAFAIVIAMLATGVGWGRISCRRGRQGFLGQDFYVGGLRGHGCSSFCRVGRGQGVHTPGISYECQNKGLAKWAIRICMKRKEIVSGKNGETRGECTGRQSKVKGREKRGFSARVPTRRSTDGED